MLVPSFVVELSTCSFGFMMLILSLTAVACGVQIEFIQEPPDEPMIETGGGGEWYDIYFTDPTCPPKRNALAVLMS